MLQFLLNKHGVRVPVNAYMDAADRRRAAALPARDASAGRRRRRPARRSPRSGCRRTCPCRSVPVDDARALRRQARRLADRDRAHARTRRSRGSRSSTGSTPAQPLLIGTKLRLPAAVARRRRPPSPRRTRQRCARRSTAGSSLLRRRPEPRARARLDGVRLQQHVVSLGRRAGRHAAAADDVGLRRERR